MELSETLCFVSSLDSALEWYQSRLGWQLVERADWGFALLAPPGQGRVALVEAASWNAEWREGDPLPAPVLSFRCTDIEAEVLALAAAGVSAGPIEGESGGVRACWFGDGEGNVFYLWSEGS